MIIKNKRTGEQKEMSYREFRVKFDKDIRISLDSFRTTQLAKMFYGYKDDSIIESDYYFDLRWNFNNFGNSAWYIEKI